MFAFGFLFTLNLIASLMHGYLTWRIGSLLCFKAAERRRRLWLFSLMLWLLYLASICFGDDASVGGLLNILALNWLGALFIGSTVMLLLDLVTGFGLWAKPYLNHGRTAALTLSVLLVAVALLQGMRAPVVVKYEVALPSLPAALDGTRLVVLSDLHLGSQRGAAWLAARLDQIEKLKPDAVILLGDIFEGHGGVDGDLRPVFAQLKAPLGIFAITGNHEFHGDAVAAIAMSEAAGVVWLRNRCQQIAPGLLLAGVDDLSRLHRNGDDGDRITPLLKSCNAKGARVLLSHSPLQVEQAASADTGLMLSGHTHGGQIWPFSFLVEQYYPYLVGQYQVGEMTLIISRGTGLWGPRMRLWQPGEILEVTFRKR